MMEIMSPKPSFESSKMVKLSKTAQSESSLVGHNQPVDSRTVNQID